MQLCARDKAIRVTNLNFQSVFFKAADRIGSDIKHCLGNKEVITVIRVHTFDKAGLKQKLKLNVQVIH